MTLFEKYNKFKKLAEDSRESFNKLLSTKEEVGDFTKEDKETVAKGTYAAGEVAKTLQTAVFAKYFDVDSVDVSGFEEDESFNSILKSLKEPLVVYDESIGDFKVTNEKDWRKYVEIEFEQFKSYFEHLTSESL